MGFKLYYSRVSISLCRGVGRHARLLCFKIFDYRPNPRTASFVAGVLFCVEPRTIMRTIKLVCKRMKLACLFCNLAITRFSVGKVVEVMRAIARDILHKFLLVDFDCFHSAHGRFDPATVGRYGCWRFTSLSGTRSVGGISLLSRALVKKPGLGVVHLQSPPLCGDLAPRLGLLFLNRVGNVEKHFQPDSIHCCIAVLSVAHHHLRHPLNF